MLGHGSQVLIVAAVVDRIEYVLPTVEPVFVLLLDLLPPLLGLGNVVIVVVRVLSVPR